MLIHRILTWPLREQDGGGGGGAAGGADPAGGGGEPAHIALAKQIVADFDAKNPKGAGEGGGGANPNPNPNNPNPNPNNPNANGPYRPEGLPDDLTGKDEKETLDKLWGAFKPLKEQASARGAVPEKPEGYKIAISDTQKKLFDKPDDLANDPAIRIWSKVAHKAGLTEKEFNVFGEFFEELHKAGLADARVDPQAIIRELSDELKDEKDPVKRQAEGSRRILAANAWVNGLETRKVLGQSEREVLSALTATPIGVRIVEKLAKLEASPGVNPGEGGGGGQGDTRSEHEKRMRAMFPTMKAG